jgi:hypothetical protein
MIGFVIRKFLNKGVLMKHNPRTCPQCLKEKESIENCRIQRLEDRLRSLEELVHDLYDKVMNED